jgi:hypothetical protein
MAAVHIAGVRLVFDGPLPDGELGPFLDPAPCEATITLRVAETPPDPAGSTFVYARHNLRFALAGDVADVWTDGTTGPLWAAMELALHAALDRLGGFVVHGSAGLVDGGAWLVPGRSGAGKSTIAREAGYARVLADEMVVVRRYADGWRAHGTPFWSQGRARPLDAGDAPLALVADPVKSDAVAAVPWAKSDAAAGLLACVTSYDETPAARRRAFELACDLVEAVPCVRLAFPKEGPWLSAARRAVREASSSTPSSAPSRSGSTGTSPGGATTSASTATSRTATSRS